MSSERPLAGVTDAEYEIVTSAGGQRPKREPILTQGWWWKLTMMGFVLGVGTLLLLYRNGHWPF